MSESAPRQTTPIIGTRMRELRKARGLTLKQLAAATGLSIGYLSQLERQAADPSVRALNVISTALGVGINWFFPIQTSPATPRPIWSCARVAAVPCASPRGSGMS